MTDKQQEEEQLATFAGGCFWCMEKPFRELPGVLKVHAGYTGGEKANPSYEEVCSHQTGHYEAVQIHFDPSIVSFDRLLDIFWQQIDPTDSGGQFFDRGASYRTAIFYHNEEQRRAAAASKEALANSSRFSGPIVTEILPAGPFYLAEAYHQNYYQANPAHYQRYRKASGRDQFIRAHWDREGSLRDKLTNLQYKVTQENGTEPPFDNEYWDNEQEGLYVDIISGEPLFSSRDKFDSGCGWPSFARPLDSGTIEEKEDVSYGMVRTEVRVKSGNSHLGHVFPDGPGPAGLRYCINSAALRFIPKGELEQEGYGQYSSLFK